MAFNALPTILQKEVRESIKKECFWNSDCQFYSRKSGRVKIRDYEAVRIINIFRKYGIDAYTGKVIGVSNLEFCKPTFLNHRDHGLSAIHSAPGTSA